MDKNLKTTKTQLEDGYNKLPFNTKTTIFFYYSFFKLWAKNISVELENPSYLLYRLGPIIHVVFLIVVDLMKLCISNAGRVEGD